MIGALYFPPFSAMALNLAHILITLFKWTLASDNRITSGRDPGDCLLLLENSIALFKVISHISAHFRHFTFSLLDESAHLIAV